jgi:3-oxoacyl-[acyl-carrier-protein] synthase-1
MRAALEEKKTINVDYMNTHGTSTPVGDSKELEAIRTVFGDKEFGEMPAIASTKSLTGHALGACWFK